MASTCIAQEAEERWFIPSKCCNVFVCAGGAGGRAGSQMLSHRADVMGESRFAIEEAAEQLKISSIFSSTTGGTTVATNDILCIKWN